MNSGWFKKGHIKSENWRKAMSNIIPHNKVPRIKKTCLVCGKKFEVIKSRENAKYCSQECYWKDLPKIIKKNKPWEKNIGKKHSQEHIEKSRKSMIGKNSGEKSNWWKGGITPLINKVRSSFKYRQWRSDVFTRDNFTCQECGARNGNGKYIYLEAHHIKRFADVFRDLKIETYEQALSCEELWNINNGQTLCRDCHYKTDNYGIKIRNKKYE